MTLGGMLVIFWWCRGGLLYSWSNWLTETRCLHSTVRILFLFYIFELPRYYKALCEKCFKSERGAARARAETSVAEVGWPAPMRARRPTFSNYFARVSPVCKNKNNNNTDTLVISTAASSCRVDLSFTDSVLRRLGGVTCAPIGLWCINTTGLCT